MSRVSNHSNKGKASMPPLEQATATMVGDWVRMDGPFELGQELYQWANSRFGWTPKDLRRAINDAAKLGLVHLTGHCWGITIEEPKQVNV